MEQKTRGFIAYFFGWIGGLVILLALKDNSAQTKFNACQSITISAAGMILSMIFGTIPYMGFLASIISLLMIVLQIIGIIKALQEEDYELPVISDITRSIFKGTLSK